MSMLYNLIVNLENKEQPDIIDKLLEELRVSENEEQNTYNPLEYLYSL